MFEHGFPPEWSTIKKLIWLKGAGIIGAASAIWKTVSGALIHITDALASPMQKCEVSLEPIQAGSGDPSPTNVRPITGWTGCEVTRTGKNLLNIDSCIIYNKYFLVSEHTALKANTDYTVSLNRGGSYWIEDALTLTLIKVSNDGQKICTFNTGEYTDIRISIRARTSGDPATKSEFLTYEPQLELGETASTYEPYQGTTISVTFPVEAGTIYNGTLNVVTGELVATHAFWTKNTSTMNNDESFPGWRSAGVRDLMGTGIDAIYSNQILNIGKSFAVNTTYDILYLPVSGGQSYGKNQTEWKALATDVQILIPLATPLTYQHTPQQVSTLLGKNNIWADCGDMEITYKAQA